MGETWIDMLDAKTLPQHIEAIKRELKRTEESWLPYQTFSASMDRVNLGDWQAWIGGVDRAVCIYGITDFVTYPGGTSLRLLWCSGEFGELFYNLWLDKIEALAQILKANFIEIRGRKGWERVFKPRGFEVKYVTLLKEI